VMPRTLTADEAVSHALLRALAAAARWCDRPENHPALAEMLAKPEYLGTDPEQSLKVLAGSLPGVRGGPDPDYMYFHRNDANRPRQADALWIYAQMLRWGQIPARQESEAAAVRVFRPDIYTRALDVAESGQAEPIVACDRVVFDGHSVSAYLQLFDLATPFGSTFRSL
jgi:hypothetical protein